MGSTPDTVHDQDACLSSLESWGGYTCSMGQAWCSEDEWRQDVIACCPSTCTSTTSSDAASVRRKPQGNGKDGHSGSSTQELAGPDIDDQTDMGGGALFELWKVS